MKRPTALSRAAPRAAPLRVALVGKVNGRGGQEFRLCYHMAGMATAVWSKRHGWTAALVNRLISLVRRGGLLRGKRATQRALERTLSAARATLKNAKATSPMNDMHAAATERRLPHAHERCFVPQDLWPREASRSTPYGAGWLATVVAVVAARPYQVLCSHLRCCHLLP